jgi:hypothetical protein
MGNQPIWLWMNLLSLDAPLVALVWQDFLARCYPALLLPQGRLVLGLTVWAIYIADRLLDVRGFAAEDEPRLHRFYREHRGVWGATLAGVIVADVLITVFWLRPVVFVHGLVVAGASIVYLWLFTGSRSRLVFWKKSFAAILFCAGVFVVASANTPGAPYSLFWPGVAFTAVCGGNLILIDGWKRGQNTGMTWAMLLVLAVVTAVAGQTRWYLAVSLSSSGLAIISWWSDKLPIEVRRVLADAALFTPLLFR